jgi:transcriptional regulator with GAF, ATPase, and Fis domain
VCNARRRNRLQRVKWSGNIREPESVIERAVIRSRAIASASTLLSSMLPTTTAPTPRMMGTRQIPLSPTTIARTRACQSHETPGSALRDASLARRGCGPAQRQTDVPYVPPARSRSTRRARIDLPIARCQLRCTRPAGPTTLRGGLPGSLRGMGCLLGWRTRSF